MPPWPAGHFWKAVVIGMVVVVIGLVAEGLRTFQNKGFGKFALPIVFLIGAFEAHFAFAKEASTKGFRPKYRLFASV